MPKKSQNKISAKRREFSFTPAVVVLNLLIVIILIMLCAFVYLYFSSPQPDPLPVSLPEPTEPPLTIVAPPAETEDTRSETSETTEPPPPMTKESAQNTDVRYTETETTVTTPASSAVEVFEKDFFADTLFIGDSIFTGLSGYELLPAANVFAEIGMGPSKALTVQINGRGVLDASAGFSRVVIMLGTNALPNASDKTVEDTAESLKTLVNKLKENKPGLEVVILSLTPIAEKNNYSLTREVIEKYNEFLQSIARETTCIFIDSGAILKDENGYFLPDYAQPDGMHLTKSAYAALLTYVQQELE